MNKIKVMSPNKNVTFETKARTWGELSSEIQNTHNISLHNMVAICGNNKLTFELPPKEPRSCPRDLPARAPRWQSATSEADL